METNQIPQMNMDTKETGCCPRFDPSGWDGVEIVFDNQSFAKAKTRSLMHIPLNMGSVYKRVMKNIMDSRADSKENYLVLSHDPSSWAGEHLFKVERDVDNEEMIKVSGKFLAKVFEGPYKNAPKWMAVMEEFVKNKGKELRKQYLFYTTCPQCLKTYGKNYVVGLVQVE